MAEEKTGARCRAWTAASYYRVRCRNFEVASGRCVTHKEERRKWAVIAKNQDTGQMDREFIDRDYLIFRIEDALKRVDPEGFGDGAALIAELYRRLPFGEPPNRDAQAVWGRRGTPIIDELEPT